MPINALPNPWIIDNSDSEDEFKPRCDRSYSLPAKPPAMPRVSARPSGPIIADWSPIVDDQSHKKKFGRQKTAPSFERAPSHQKPIFSGPSSLKSSFLSLAPSPARSLYSSRTSLQESISIEKSSSTYTPDTPPASPLAHQSPIDPFAFMQEYLNRFIYSFIPKDYPSFIHCILRRDRQGLQKGFFPTYYLHAERPSDGKKFFLLAARKIAKLNRQSEYLITTNVETLSEKDGGDGFVGRLRANGMTNTEYTLYDNGKSPNKFSYKSYHAKHGLRRELAAIIYNTNILGLKGPREINTLIPKLEYDIQPAQDEDTIIDRWRSVRLSDVIQLRNQSPKFDDDIKAHMLQFNGDIPVQPSVKNFQMVVETDNYEEEIVMEFGRTSRDTFTCDFRFPLSPIQAFGIALSSFDSGLARE